MEVNVNELIDVLQQGNNHITELDFHLNQPLSSPGACKLSLSQLQSALATATAMANSLEHAQLLPLRPASHSPRSDCSDKAVKEQERRERCKKRKALPRWSRKIRAFSGSAMEVLMEDGKSWRKYGQKNILGAKFPRGYYRCTYRNSHGCVATKQVQRSDDDPVIFNVTYRGDHTCNHGVQNNSFRSSQPNEAPKQEQQQQLLQIIPVNVRKKDLSSDDPILEPSPSFSFLSMPTSCVIPESYMISCDSISENCYMGSELDALDIFPATASSRSSPMAGMDFGWEQLFFDNEIPFELC